MKHLMRYEGYTIQERVDDILDKISKYGQGSLTKLEKEFLDAYSKGDEKEIHDKIGYKENEVVFEDDFGRFKFEYSETEDYGDEIWYKGTMYVPDIKLQNGKKLEGRLEGKIISHHDGQSSLEFEKGGYEIFDYCEGLEYELDSFVDYIIGELQK